MKVQATVRSRMQDILGSVNAQNIVTAGQNALKKVENTCKKAQYLPDFAGKVNTGEFMP